jgi:3-phosphoshikimate 1-carboxyvinyltransferase
LLIAAPLAPAGVVTEIDVPLLNEKPYIELTLSYLKAQQIPYETKPDFSWFRIPGGASYNPINGPVPGDFSSAAFPACAAAVSGLSLAKPCSGEARGLSPDTITLLGLDPNDPQGDKVFFDILKEMGCKIEWVKKSEWEVCISRPVPLKAGTFDLNAAPDLLPAAAAAAAYAQGVTLLGNVAHARIKETDRIAVMAEELGKLGVETEECADALIIKGTGPNNPKTAPPVPLVLNGHGDHRIVMALAVAALGASGPVEIEGAESAAVTYPGFLELLNAKP